MRTAGDSARARASQGWLGAGPPASGGGRGGVTQPSDLVGAIAAQTLVAAFQQVEQDRACSCSSWVSRMAFRRTAIERGLRCAPPMGSPPCRSGPVQNQSRRGDAQGLGGVLALSVLFHRIEGAQPSGVMTEWVAYCSISVASPTPMANALRQPPSPITVQTIGTRLDRTSQEVARDGALAALFGADAGIGAGRIDER